MAQSMTVAFAEGKRIVAENRRREREGRRAAPWEPAKLFLHANRKRVAARMLREANVFPKPDSHCLEIGFGTAGWFGDLITWGVRETSLHGIELDPIKAKRVHEVLPLADLRVGDATALPWESNSFQLVVASTVLTSILDQEVRALVANEITRVLGPGGALVWYDFAFNNASNPSVRKVNRAELKRLFPQLAGRIRSLTLAPPLARMVAPRSWVLATILEMIPFLRTHLFAVLVKSS